MDKKTIKVNFYKGCAILYNGKEKKLFVDKFGVWLKQGLHKTYLKDLNCIIL